MGQDSRGAHQSALSLASTPLMARRMPVGVAAMVDVGKVMLVAWMLDSV